MNRRTLRPAISSVAVLALTGVLAAACGSSSNPVASNSGASTGTGASTPAASSGGTVTVGSANFPENELLADIYIDALKAKGIKTAAKLDIGSRETYYPLLKNGDIDVIPDYNGALLAYLKPTAAPTTEAETNTLLAAAVDPSLSLLTPSSAEDKDAMVVTKATATKDHLTSIADLAPYASQFTVGGASEFQTRQEGFLGLKADYGLTFKGFKALDESGPLTIAALKGGSIQVGDIYSTDPSISADNFVALTDPKNLFGSQNVTPLINTAGVNATAQAALNAVSAALTTPILAKLVGEVVGQHMDATAVASSFISSAGLGS